MIATGTGDIETQGRQDQAQGCPQVFAVIITGDRSLTRLGTNPHANHSAWKATIHQATWGRRSIVRIYINTIQSGRIQGTGTGTGSAENMCRKMRIPPTYGRACRSRHDCFHFSWKDGGGREERRRERGQLSKVCKTSSFGIFSTGNGQFPKAWSYRSTGLILQKPMHMDNFTSPVTLAGQKYLQFLLFHLLNESLQTRNRATLSLIWAPILKFYNSHRR